MWKSNVVLKFSTVFATIAALVALSQSAVAQDALLKTIKDRGVLRVCDVDYAPWNVKDPATDQWEGINVDIANEIAQGLKVKLEHVDANWSTLIPNMETKRCDAAMAGLFISPQRAQLVSFTRPFAEDGIGLFVPKASTATGVADLDQKGKVIAALAGSVDEGIARKLFKNATVKTVTASGVGVVILEVAAGRADAAAAGYYGNSTFLRGNPNLPVKIIPDLFLTRTPIAFAVPAGEYFFRDYMNAVILVMEQNGRLKELIDKWTR
jgi:ABC-type amino acid transport substrate-binding protein